MKNTTLKKTSIAETILVVDDSQFRLESMKTTLNLPGWNVITADSGENVLTWLLTLPNISLIILHAQMQDKNRFELAKLIRQNYAIHVPILFISAVHSLDEYITRDFSVDISDYLIEPINKTILIQCIELYINFYHQRHQIKTINKQAIPKSFRCKHVTHRKKYSQNPATQGRGEGCKLSGELKDVSTFPVEIRLRPMCIGDQYFISILFRDLSSHKAYEDIISYQAMHDTLTGLPSRAVLYDRIHQGLIQAQKSSQQFAVIFIGIDRFKVICNSLGQGAGDQLIIAAANRIKSALGKTDTFVHYESDEFVLLASLTHINNISLLFDKLLKENKKTLIINEQELHISISIGVCIVNDDSCQPDELLKHANTTMNDVKSKGGGDFQFFSSELNQRIERRLALEMGMVFSLRNKEFVLYYQPKIDLKKNKIAGLEALVRWQHPEKGMIFPNEFISVAEETRFILPLGEWILRTASEQAIEWHRSGILNGRIAVNISGVQIASKEFMSTLKYQVEHKIIHPHLLELELTETSMLENPNKVGKFLGELKMMGFTLALDDFGTGYSGLSWLSEFPCDTIKIDQSFVSKALLTEKHRIIINHSINMARQLGVNVVAEGVETRQEQDLLTSMGCELVQGYFYSKPLQAQKFEQVSNIINQRGNSFKSY